MGLQFRGQPLGAQLNVMFTRQQSEIGTTVGNVLAVNLRRHDSQPVPREASTE
jgi:hypothetical protein